MRISSGFLKNRELVTSKKNPVRPTSGKVRSQVFDMCQHWIEGARFLDLCAGTGAMGFEAISRGAKSCTFIEKNNEVAERIRTNIERFGIAKQCSLLSIDALQAISMLSKKEETFSFVYIDPPYEHKELLNEIITAVDTLLPLEQDARVIVEARKKSFSPPELSRLHLLSQRVTGDTELFIFRFC